MRPPGSVSEVLYGVAIAVLTAAVLVPAVRWMWGRVVIPWVLAPIGRNIGEHVSEILTAQVDERIDQRVKANLTTMKHNISEIKKQLETNGGSTVKDIVIQTKETLDDFMDESEHERMEIWETLAEHGIDRRQRGERD